jgi:N-methylhydantoinase A/oxoprolinase/acetone carboxylase beta subunit
VPEIRVGIVSGASSTDAVAIDARDRILASATVPALPRDDAGAGLAAVVAALVGGGVVPEHVRWVTLGTGHERRDVVAAHGVARVAVVRIGAPLTLAVAPLATWPATLREAVRAGAIVVRGGAEYDGREVAQLDEEAIGAFLCALGERADAVAITGVFSLVTPEHELAAAAIARRELGAARHVSMSHELGTVGLLERENTTVLGAALARATQRLAAELRAAVEAQAIDAELFFTQNDGTLMSVEHALRYPALMIAAGPGTSMRGAAWLSGVGDAVVAHVGTAATTIGVLVNASPREIAGPSDIAGVRTGLRLPDARYLSPDAALVDAVGAARAGQLAKPLVVVGPGQGSVPDRLEGVSEVIRPPDGALAHAIGAATGAVSGQAELICAHRPDHRRRAIDEARAVALGRAVDAGADPAAVEVAEVEEVPFAHLLRPALRIRVRAVGPRG